MIAQLPANPTKGEKRKAEASAQEPAPAAKKPKGEAGEGLSSITPKVHLHDALMKILRRPMQKGEAIYEAKECTGGFQATVRLVSLPGAWAGRTWAGEVCSTKQKAEQSA